MNAGFIAAKRLASRTALRDTKSCGGAREAALLLVFGVRFHNERYAAEKLRF
ncbi:hypothetical protein LK533_17175 [Sphingomonas sp. PL-96]|uniref:hypothetical protein n=1 Tax=Sphingomonas sp. PL-96 TaxID=2887201 RepID=UPI001E5E8213|nr:hypothetical protein [Sphingomonas sp. PL-96]MCC2978384.1 hypothetical protein [Sphingomonas sp. PL-96]